MAEISPATIFLASAAVFATVVYLYSRPRSAKKNTKIYGKPVPGSKEKEGETRPYRNVEHLDKLLTTPAQHPEIQTVYDVLEHAVKHYPSNLCIGTRPLIKMHKEETVVRGEKRVFSFPQLGAYEWLTYAQVHKRVVNIASGLVEIGVKPGTFLAMYEDTRAEWTIMARAAYAQSAVLFTVYANLGVDALEYALGQGSVSHVFTNGKLLAPLEKLCERLDTIKYIIYNDKPDQSAMDKLRDQGVNVMSFEELEELGAKNPHDANPPNPKDLACIMYTSGSTGVPKGVMISHANLVAALGGMVATSDLNKDDVFLHYLPLAHSFAFVVESIAIYYGLPMGYGSPRTLSDNGTRQCKGDIQELRPTVLVAVPTVYEKIRQGVLMKLRSSGAVTRALFNKAFKDKLNAIAAGTTTPLWDKIVFSKFKERMGGRMRLFISGSAPLSPQAQDFIRVCFGCPVVQGWGLTETCSSGTLQSSDDLTPRNIGRPIASVELKLRDVADMGYTSKDKPYPRGEILVRGGPVTLGYFKQEEKTKEAFLEDGWFATGDIGQILDNGTVQIIDRKKHLIKPPHGEYIALEKLETTFMNSPYVEAVCVYIDASRYHPVAIIYPSKEMIEHLAKEKGITGDFEDLCKNEDLRGEITKHLVKLGREKGLKSIELVRGVALCHYEWTPQNAHLTAAMKLNRNTIYKTWEEEINAMYAKIEKETN